MTHEFVNPEIIMILTIGLAMATLFGFLASKLKLSPILGYLAAGYLIGPYSPGYVADIKIAEQLAEIGVVLMMFGVGMHFHWEDLYRVKKIAIPGAIGQTLVATVLSVIALLCFGWTIQAASVFGMAVGVASTIVLVRGLSDNHLLHTQEGHIAVGWLIVEDLLTVFFLLILPSLMPTAESMTLLEAGKLVGMIVLKCTVLVLLVFTIGKKVAKYLLTQAIKVTSHELFTITTLAIAFVIATSSAYIFGTSIALGAFLAGMLIGQTDVHHQVSANTLPMRDAFLVIFFLAVGMLFNPFVIYTHTGLFLLTLAIILVAKPLTAYLITIAGKYPSQVALTVAIALAQIGEFSFILAEEANRLDIIPDVAYDLLVACAIVSIAVNPSLFKLLPPQEEKEKA